MNFSSAEDAVLSYLYQAARANRVGELESLGISLDDIRVLRQVPLTGTESQKGIQRRVLHSFKIDRSALSERIDETAHQHRQDDVIERAIKAGATKSMLGHFFQISRRNVQSTCKVMGVCNHGCPETYKEKHMPKRSVLIDRVVTELRKYSDIDRMRPYIQCEILLEVSEEQGMNISTLWEVIQEAEDDCEFGWGWA